MSLRPSDRAAFGSLFGPAIQTPAGGLWARGWNAASPTSSPPSTPSAGIPVPRLELETINAMDTDQSSTVDGVCPTWSYDTAHATLLFFEQCPSSHAVITTMEHPSFNERDVAGSRRLLNSGPVSMRTVAADRVVARAMTEGYIGFDLMRGRMPVVRVEVACDAEITRMAVVSSSYSPLALSAGMVGSSTMLEFESPTEHVQALEALRERFKSGDCSVGYVPTSEFCVTGAFDALRLETAGFSEPDRAERVWEQTRALMKSISERAADCVDMHTNAELQRVGAANLLGCRRYWRSHV